MTEHTPGSSSRPSSENPIAVQSPHGPRHEKGDLLGIGGMAAVWRGVRILGDGSRQDVAIKEIRPGVRQHPDAIERFCREARLCMAVNHENVVRVYDLVRQGEDFWIIMEYVDGVSLQAVVESGLQLPATVQRFIHGQIVQGLDGLHREGILHRDLSPTNVLITRDGMVKLIDLGIAKDLAGPATDGGCKGTLSFSSPESLRGEAADEASDLYSAMAVLFYCLTGNAPVSGETPEAVLANHEAGDLARFPALLPPDLGVILEDLRKPRAERRFQQTAQIMGHLFESAEEHDCYFATRDEVAIFVQSVMAERESSGRERVRVTEVMSDIPASKPGGVAGADHDALDPASTPEPGGFIPDPIPAKAGGAGTELGESGRSSRVQILSSVQATPDQSEARTAKRRTQGGPRAGGRAQAWIHPPPESHTEEDDQVDISALLETLAACFNGADAPGERAAALRALLSEMALDGSDDGSDDGSNDSSTTVDELEESDRSATDEASHALVEAAESRPDDLLALLACLPDEDDDPGLDSTRSEASAEGAETAGDGATEPLGANRRDRRWFKPVVVLAVFVAISVLTYEAYDASPDGDDTSSPWTDRFYPATHGDEK